jgi:hypothetical protein
MAPIAIDRKHHLVLSKCCVTCSDRSLIGSGKRKASEDANSPDSKLKFKKARTESPENDDKVCSVLSRLARCAPSADAERVD